MFHIKDLLLSTELKHNTEQNKPPLIKANSAILPVVKIPMTIAIPPKREKSNMVRIGFSCAAKNAPIITTIQAA